MPRNPINTYPRGFLSLLDAKTGGETPPQFADTVTPALEMLRFYLGAQQERVFAEVFGPSTNGFWVADIFGVGVLQVPFDEVWWLHQVDSVAQADVPASTSMTWWPALRWPGVDSPAVRLGGGGGSAAGQRSGQSGWNVDLSMICLPGSIFGIFVTAISLGTAFDLDYAVTITRMKV